MPLVARRVEQLFGQPPQLKVNPDEVVALGAAIQAHALNRSKAAHKRRSAHDQLAKAQPRASGEHVPTRPPDADPTLAPADVPRAPPLPKNLGAPPAPPPPVPEFFSFTKAPAVISFSDVPDAAPAPPKAAAVAKRPGSAASGAEAAASGAEAAASGAEATGTDAPDGKSPDSSHHARPELSLPRPGFRSACEPLSAEPRAHQSRGAAPRRTDVDAPNRRHAGTRSRRRAASGPEACAAIDLAIGAGDRGVGRFLAVRHPGARRSRPWLR